MFYLLNLLIAEKDIKSQKVFGAGNKYETFLYKLLSMM
jgi:hypothetical protein